MEQDEIQWKMLSIAYVSNPVNMYFMVEGKAGKKEKYRLVQLKLRGEQLKVNRHHILWHLYFHYRNTPRYQDGPQFESIDRATSVSKMCVR